MTKTDFPIIEDIYIKAFAGEPWDEKYKCKTCDQNYGEKTKRNYCIVCNEALALFYPKGEIIKRLKADSQKPGFLGFIAENKDQEIVGFRWNIDSIPDELVQILPEGRYSRSIDMAVKRECEGNSIATNLYQILIQKLETMKYSGIITTTKRNTRPYFIYSRIGFTEIKGKCLRGNKERPWLIKILEVSE